MGVGDVESDGGGEEGEGDEAAGVRSYGTCAGLGTKRDAVWDSACGEELKAFQWLCAEKRRKRRSSAGVLSRLHGVDWLLEARTNDGGDRGSVREGISSLGRGSTWRRSYSYQTVRSGA